VAIGCVAIAGLYAARARRRAGCCRRCGVTFPVPGDLCPNCRREAVESRRRAASASASETLPVEEPAAVDEATVLRQAERQPATPAIDETRAHEFGRSMDAERVRREEDECLRAEAARAERTRLAAEESRRAEERRCREEELRELRTAVTAPPDVFDPYLVLGVPRNASSAEIHAAYETARQKYAPDEVAHLGAELREHFKAKSLALERAYECLRSEPTGRGD
jgi:DnaJ-domain-containing protein 1